MIFAIVETMATEQKADLVIGRTIRIDPIFHERRFLFDEKLVFVLMPFSEPWSDRIWEKLRVIIESKSLRAERADNRFGAIITEDIWTAIMECRLLICDTTGWNPNVFYELGIAHTIGKPVIMLTQPTHHLPFDTQGLRHLVYTDNPDGMKKLDEELPPWIDHCLSIATRVGLVYRLEREALKMEKEAARMRKTAAAMNKKATRNKIKEAWLLNTKGYDPPLPPMSNQVLRTQIGSVKARMMEYAYPLSAEKIETLITDLKRVWPETWEGLIEEEAAKKSAEIAEVVNKHRAEYREKINQ
jgi:hypothetical protein